MKRARIRIGWIVVGIAALGVAVTLIAHFVGNRIGVTSASEAESTSACAPLPKGFESSQLVGTWVGRYFGAIDKLVIRADGKYQQTHTDDVRNFTSMWHNWHLEDTSNGYALMHLEGMRRCDGVDPCEPAEGGLPAGEVAINPCEPAYVYEVDEVILFVTGYRGSVPRGLVLWHARPAGSDWNWGYQLQE